MDLIGAYDDEDNDSDQQASPSHDVGRAGVDPDTVGKGTEEHEGDAATQNGPFWSLSGQGTDAGARLTAAVAGLSREKLERLRSGSPASLGVPSDVSSPASQHGSTNVDAAYVAHLEVPAGGTLARDSVTVPCAPPGPVSGGVMTKVEQLLAERKKGTNLNDQLRDKKEFHNPGILERLVSEFKIMESGTNYSPDLFNPEYPKELYYDSLAKQAHQRDAMSRATRTSIGFDSAGVQQPDFPAAARPVVERVKSSTSNTQTTAAAASAAATLAKVHVAAANIASQPAANPTPAAGTDGAPVKKKSKWDSATKASSTAPPVHILTQPRPPMPPGAPLPAGAPGGMLPAALQPGLIQQQILQRQLLMQQQQQLTQQQLASKR